MVTRHLSTALAATLAAAATALAAAPGASAATRIPDTIVPFESIGGFSLGDSLGSIERKLGRPDHVVKVGGRPNGVFYDNPSLVFSVSRSGRVQSIETVHGSWRTPQGLHLGSTEAALRRVYPHIRCAGDECNVDRGSRSMGFSLSQGRVDTIEIDDQVS